MLIGSIVDLSDVTYKRKVKEQIKRNFERILIFKSYPP